MTTLTDYRNIGASYSNFDARLVSQRISPTAQLRKQPLYNINKAFLPLRSRSNYEVLRRTNARFPDSYSQKFTNFVSLSTVTQPVVSGKRSFVARIYIDLRFEPQPLGRLS